jgi:predicted nucleic acid-binding protein
MNAADAFIDTNVLLYLISSDETKATRAEAIVGDGGVVSAQVLNEFADVALRNCSCPWPKVQDVLSIVKSLCDVQPVTVETHDLGLSIAQRYRFRVYDGMIVAAAILADCRVLFSEDMRHRQRIGSLEIRNPFAAR